MGWEIALVASTLLSAGSSIVGGMQQNAAADRQAEADRSNAEQSRINAGVALNASEAEAARTQQATRRRVATAANQAGASGIDPGFGSPLDVMADISAEGALDAQIQRWKGSNQGRSYLAQASGYEQRANAAEAAGSDAFTGGLIRAGTTVLGGAARYGQMQMRMSNPGSPSGGIYGGLDG